MANRAHLKKKNLLRGAMLRTLFFGEDIKTATRNAKSVYRQLNRKHRPSKSKISLEDLFKVVHAINILNRK